MVQNPNQTDDVRSNRREGEEEDDESCMDKRGKVRSTVHHLSFRGYGHNGKYGGLDKRNLGPKKKRFKRLSHQQQNNPNSNPKRFRPYHVWE
uniref:Uncharacterized protein n=1 Tax=Lactuca sativa TaxID=4236 RepID=A0A9R1WY15_LACSA|nr:hypothetical protein LSAT_V11C800426440 [Lactuca sativa]